MSLLSLFQNNIATPLSVPVVNGVAAEAKLYIENQPVDISEDISSLLTFAIDDIKDFATRQTTFSKTIVLPGTSRNNALFGNIFELGNANDYNATISNIGYNFNASKSASCIMFQDNLQTFKGSMRLLQINKDRGRIEYEIALNGTLTNLTVALSSGYLTELDFSAYDHVYSIANIAASWDTAAGSGYTYPLIDYGKYSDVAKHNWNIGTIRAALYVKEYIDKMFTKAGYRYECALFNTARFKGLIVPYNRKLFTVTNTRVLYQLSNSTSFQVGAFVSNTQVNFLVNGVSVRSQTVTTTGSTNITGTININTGNTLKITITGQFVNSVNFNGGGSIGAFTTADNITYTYAGGSSATINISFLLNILPMPPRPMVAGETLSYTSSVTGDSTTSLPVLVSIGDTVKLNDTIPQNIKQIDFFSSIIKLFNLYVYEDQFDDKLIKISPFVNFYSTDSANSVDWTYKLNRDKLIQVKPLSELNSKTYKFSYKDDSDFWNDLYKKRYNQNYGSYIFDSQFEFASAQASLELIFASTPLVGYSTEDKIYSTIFKKSNDIEEQTDSVIRILQTKKMTGVSSWAIKDPTGVTTLGSFTSYMYAGHLDNPNNPTNDLNFGALKELFFTLVIGDLSVTQFNVYWSSYMAEITDKDSKLLTAKFYLTPMDIFNLTFSKYIYVDGVLFRLNKITDYNTSNPNDCEVQLIKVLNTIY